MLPVPTKDTDEKRAIQFNCPSVQDVKSYVSDQQIIATAYERRQREWEEKAAEGGYENAAEEQAMAALLFADAQAKLQRQGIDSFCGNLLWGSGLRASSTGCHLDWLLIDMSPARAISSKVS
jgi:hypothetical protein